jgi:hypothetical protein
MRDNGHEMATQKALEAPARPVIGDVLQEIEEYRSLEPGWDSYDALPIAAETISLAQSLLTRIAEVAQGNEVGWRRPAVSPGSDGGIAISWKNNGRWLLVQVIPGQTHLDCVTRAAGKPPNRRLESTEDAVKAALWVLAAR